MKNQFVYLTIYNDIHERWERDCDEVALNVSHIVSVENLYDRERKYSHVKMITGKEYDVKENIEEIMDRCNEE